MTDAFSPAGRQWLAAQLLPGNERDTIDAALRQIDFLTEEITTIEHDLAQFVLASPDARRLLTIPGVFWAGPWAQGWGRRCRYVECERVAARARCLIWLPGCLAWCRAWGGFGLGASALGRS
jgi:hypothetical protein